MEILGFIGATIALAVGILSLELLRIQVKNARLESRNLKQAFENLKFEKRSQEQAFENQKLEKEKLGLEISKPQRGLNPSSVTPRIIPYTHGYCKYFFRHHH